MIEALTDGEINAAIERGRTRMNTEPVAVDASTIRHATASSSSSIPDMLGIPRRAPEGSDDATAEQLQRVDILVLVRPLLGTHRTWASLSTGSFTEFFGRRVGWRNPVAPAVRNGRL